MNRIVKISINIVMIALILLLGYQEFCYADVITTSVTNQLISPFLFLFYIIDFIAILCLESERAIIKKKIKDEKKKNTSDNNIEELEKKKSELDTKIKKWNRIFFLLLGISILLFIYEIIVQSNRSGVVHIKPAE